MVLAWYSHQFPSGELVQLTLIVSNVQFDTYFDAKEFLNSLIKQLKKSLLRTASNQKSTSWRTQDFVLQDGGGQFGAGKISISPGTFMERRLVCNFNL
jgi:hypothetical protein